MVVWLQSVTIVDQQATITSTRISSIVMALWLQSVTVMDQQAIFTITSTKLCCLSMTATDCGHRAITILLKYL